MGWLASATLPPTFCLGFSQTFPVFISISVLASPECFLPSVSMCYVVNEDREQSTPEETINKAPRTFVVAGESLQVFVHSSQRGISKDSPFLWKFQNCRIVKKNGASLFLTFSAPEQTRHCLWACPKVFVFMDKISGWRNGGMNGWGKGGINGFGNVWLRVEEMGEDLFIWHEDMAILKGVGID